MVERGWGRIVLLGTVGSTRPGVRRPGYYAAKAALPSIAVSLSQALTGTGVTVNVVSPGIIGTFEVQERLAGRGDDQFAAHPRPARTTPPGGSATVEEVGDLVAFVASDRAGFVNGANLRIDGGAAMRPN